MILKLLEKFIEEKEFNHEIIDNNSEEVDERENLQVKFQNSFYVKN